MAQVPEHIQARRVRGRAMRRRRRAAALGALFVILVAALVVVMAASGGAARHHTGVSRSSAISSVPRAPHQPQSSIEARGNANIRRLATLALPVYCGGPRGHDLA